MSIFSKFLKKSGSSSIELETALNEIKIAEFESVVAEAEKQYRVALLDDNESKIDAAELKLGKSKRDLARAAAMIAELQHRISAAREREEQAAFEVRFKNADAAARSAAQSVIDRYPALAREIVALLENVCAADLQVQEFNRFASARSAQRQLSGCESVPSVHERIFDNFLRSPYCGSLMAIHLPSLDEEFAPIWGARERGHLKRRPQE